MPSSVSAVEADFGCYRGEGFSVDARIVCDEDTLVVEECFDSEGLRPSGPSRFCITGDAGMEVVVTLEGISDHRFESFGDAIAPDGVDTSATHCSSVVDAGGIMFCLLQDADLDFDDRMRFEVLLENSGDDNDCLRAVFSYLLGDGVRLCHRYGLPMYNLLLEEGKNKYLNLCFLTTTELRHLYRLYSTRQSGKKP